MNFATDVFRQRVASVDEYDYGDFMRTTNFYLNEMRQDLSILQDRAINRKLAEMQGYLQFNPNWSIRITRMMLANDVRFIDELVRGHEQDWESESFYHNT